LCVVLVLNIGAENIFLLKVVPPPPVIIIITSQLSPSAALLQRSAGGPAGCRLLLLRNTQHSILRLDAQKSNA
jgi:hypothetical protein